MNEVNKNQEDTRPSTGKCVVTKPADVNVSYVGEKAKPEKKEKEQSHTTQLLNLVKEQDFYLFCDQYGKSYVRLDLGKGKRNLPVEGETFAEHLGFLDFQKFGWAPAKEVVQAVIRQVKYMAKVDGNQHDLHVRVARHEGATYLDLDGVKAVKITRGNWKVVDDTPVLFRWYDHQHALPIPVHGGNPWELFEYMNIPEEFHLITLVWIVSIFIPDIPIPALVLYGPPGSVKSTAFKLVKRVTDPGIPEVLSKVRDAMELSQFASQHRLLNLDNLSGLPTQVSNTICAAITGEGYAKRANYTDDETFVRDYRCVFGLGGIYLPAELSDLLDRSIIVPVECVPDENRKQERELYPEFEKAKPEILGGLLDALAGALLVDKHLKHEKLPRMADFAALGAAIAEALGRDKGEFIEAYTINRSQQHSATLESDVCALAIIEFMKSRADWTGTATQLLNELTTIAGILDIDRRSQTWPKSATRVSGKLNYLEEGLRSAGILIERPQRSSGKKLIIMKNTRLNQENPMKTTCNDATTKNYDGGSDSSVTPEAASTVERDASDASDATLQNLPEGVSLDDMTTWPEEWEEVYQEKFGIMYENDDVNIDQAKAGALEAVKKRFLEEG